MDELKSFLDELKLERYYDTLFDEGYETYEDLKVMEMNDIKDLDIKLPHKKRIINKIKEMREKDNQTNFRSSSTNTTSNTSSDDQETPLPSLKVEENTLGRKENKEIQNALSSPSPPSSFQTDQRIASSDPNQSENQTNKISITSTPNSMPISNPTITNKPFTLTHKINTNTQITTKTNQITPTPTPTPTPTLTFSKNNIENLISNLPSNPPTKSSPNMPPPSMSDIEILLSTYKPEMLDPPINKKVESTPITQPQDKNRIDQLNYFQPSNAPIQMGTQNVYIDKYELKRLNGLLLNCCQMGNLESAREYIEKGANELDKALACASSGGHKKLALFLIEKGAKNFDKAFLSACKSGNLEMVLEMCKRGFFIFIFFYFYLFLFIFIYFYLFLFIFIYFYLFFFKKQKKGVTNLEEGFEEAKKKNHKNIEFHLEKIIAHDGNVESNLFEVETILTLKQMNSLLLNYSQIGNIEMVKKYVKMGANNLNKALSCACSGGQKSIVDYLLKKGREKKKKISHFFFILIFFLFFKK